MSRKLGHYEEDEYTIIIANTNENWDLLADTGIDHTVEYETSNEMVVLFDYPHNKEEALEWLQTSSQLYYN